MNPNNIIHMSELDNVAKLLTKSHNKRLAIVILFDDEGIDAGMYRRDLDIQGKDIREALALASASTYGYEADDIKEQSIFCGIEWNKEIEN